MNKSKQVLVEKPKKKSNDETAEAGEVEVFIMGKSYKVPAGLTIMKALEYSGYRFICFSGVNIFFRSQKET